MQSKLLDAIRETQRLDGVLTVKTVNARCPDLSRRTVGRGIQEWQEMWAKTERNLRGVSIQEERAAHA